jgi:hypothetical protein
VSLKLNCDSVMHLQEQSYVGQHMADMLTLFALRPDSETVWTQDTLKQDDSLMVVARPADVLNELRKARLFDSHCKVPVLCLVDYVKTVSPNPADSDPSPWSGWSPKCNCKMPRYSFDSVISSWPVGSAWTDSPHFNVEAKATVFAEHVASAFDITNLDAWKLLAPCILDNTEIWHSGTIHDKLTNSLHFNVNKRGTPEHAAVMLQIEEVFADMAGALRSIFR